METEFDIADENLAKELALEFSEVLESHSKKHEGIRLNNVVFAMFIVAKNLGGQCGATHDDVRELFATLFEISE